jgi:hypothetical protein
VINTIISFLNSPVPSIATTSNDGLYFVDAMGFGAIMFFTWWFLCFFIRNGFDGSRMALRALQRKEHPNLRLILLNNWKVIGSTEDETGPVDLREPKGR